MEIFTKTRKLKDVLSEKKANEFAKRFHIKADELEFVEKSSLDETDLKVEENERAVIKYVSTISVDRDGDILLPQGAMLDDFNKSRMVLYGHNYGHDGQLPIGKDMWIKADKKGVLAKIQYAKHEKAEDIYQMHKDGMPLPASVGFIPVEAVRKSDKASWDNVVGQVKATYGLEDKAFDGADRIFTKWYLLEHSEVPVAANPDAIALAVDEGKFVFKSLDFKRDILGDQDGTIVESGETDVTWIIEENKELKEEIKSLKEEVCELAEKVQTHDDFLFKQPEQKYVTKEQADKKFEGIAQEIKDEINRKLGKV